MFDLTWKAMSLGLLMTLSTMIHAQENLAYPYPPANKRGALLESQLISSLSKEQLDIQLAPLGLNARVGVKLYRAVYQTVTPQDFPRLIKASALIAIPDTASSVFPWILMQHYTILSDREAPTVTPFEGLFEASQGFAAVVPDNLGFGEANQVYPAYLFAKAYAENGLDALRAARAFASAEDLNFGPLFLKGYSEGGYATLALQQELETHHTAEFPLAGSAPSSGPYNIIGFRSALAQPQISSVFLNNLFLSYEAWLSPKFKLDRVYSLDVDFVRELYSGNQDLNEIKSQLPTETKAVFKERFINDLAAEKPRTRAARLFIRLLKENSLPQGEWTPKTPTRFFHCADDDVVPVSVTKEIVAQILAKNPTAPATLGILPSPDPSKPYTHGSCPLFFGYLSYFAEILQAAPAQ